MKLRISLPLQLIVVIVGVVLLGNFIPMQFVQVSYTFSVLFKELLGLILPFMVFFFVMAGILSFQRNAPLVLAILLGTIFFSNAIVALVSYGTMSLFSPFVSCERTDAILAPTATIESLIPFSIPVPVSAIHALLAAISLGIFFSVVRVPRVVSIINQVKSWIEKALMYGFIPLLPLYVLGFLLKIYHEGLLSCLLAQYGGAVVLILSMQILYLILMYLLASGFSVSRAFGAIKNALPSYLTAFSTMSSTATVPVSIKAAEENTGTTGLPSMAMPIMANVHLLGDSIGTPILAMVTMLVFTGTLPGLMQYAVFVFYFCTTMFAVSGIPGGGILVMIPILVSQLGFTPQMISIITTLYFLLDPFGTAANVMGDGALVIMVNKILKRLRIAA